MTRTVGSEKVKRETVCLDLVDAKRAFWADEALICQGAIIPGLADALSVVETTGWRGGIGVTCILHVVIAVMVRCTKST